MSSGATLYLDHASTSWPKEPQVVTTVAEALVDPGVAPDRGGGGRGRAAAAWIERARRAVAELLSVATPDQVTFTLNATDALNLALKGALRPGDEVVTSSIEHNSVARPLAGLARDRGVKIVVIAADAAGRLDAEAVLRAVTSRTRLVALAHVSNVTGVVQPVATIGRALRGSSRAPLLLVDAAQSAGYRDLEEVSAVADLLAGAGHKGPGGPLGTGFLWTRPGVEVAPLREGGTGSRSEERFQPSDWPGALEAGSPNVPGIAGLAVACESRRRGSTLERVAAARRAAAAEFGARVATIAGVSRYGASGDAEPLFALRLRGYSVAEASALLESEFGVVQRAGLHCNPGVHQAIGSFPEGTLRLSFGALPTDQEIERATDALAELARSAP